MVRGVSDLADKNKDKDESGGGPAAFNWWEYACDVAAAYTLAMIRSAPIDFLPAPITPKASKQVIIPPPSSTETSPARDGSPADAAVPPAATSEPPAPPAAGKLSIKELNELADLLAVSGRADESSRPSLIYGVGVADPDQVSFIKTPSSKGFAIQFVVWLQNTGNREALVTLCEILGEILKGEPAERLQALRNKLG